MAEAPVRVGGLLADDLADQFGTPLYAYDADVIRRRWRAFTEPFGAHPPRVLYGVKANPVTGVVQLIRSLGAGLDACSPGDLAVARRVGAAGEEISYVGVSVSDEDLRHVVDSGAFFTADSLDAVGRYLRRPGARSEIGLRVTVDVVAGFHHHVQAGAWDSKFGIQPDQLAEADEIARSQNANVRGLHAHIGSDILDPAPHLTVLERLLGLAAELPSVQFVNLGGGWGTPFLPEDEEYPLKEFARGVTDRLDRFAADTGRRLELRVEPGAYLVMDSGVLLTRVTGIKPPVATPHGPTPAFVGVDSSYNHVVSAVIYDTHHPVELARDGGFEPADGAEVTVVGNLMQAGDVLARARRLPTDLRPGDVLVVHKCGGYTSSRSTVFNGRPRPAEVLVDGDRPHLIRRRESPEDLFCLDVPVPSGETGAPSST